MWWEQYFSVFVRIQFDGEPCRLMVGHHDGLDGVRNCDTLPDPVGQLRFRHLDRSFERLTDSWKSVRLVVRDHADLHSDGPSRRIQQPLPILFGDISRHCVRSKQLFHHWNILWH